MAKKRKTNGVLGRDLSHLQHKRYPVPPGHSCSEFVMRELDRADQLEAAMMVDRPMTGAKPANIMATYKAEAHEAMRLAFVTVDGERVNGEVPFMGLDHWKLKSIQLAQLAFNELNGVEDEDSENFIKGAVILDSDLTPIPQESEEEVTAG